MARITNLRAIDLRFPTSQSLDGSDAMNPDPDCSAAYMPPSLPGFSIEMKPESICRLYGQGRLKDSYQAVRLPSISSASSSGMENAALPVSKPKPALAKAESSLALRLSSSATLRKGPKARLRASTSAA